MTAALVYIHVPGDAAHVALAHNFTVSYQQFQPGVLHRTIVVCQGAPPSPEMRKLFLTSLPNCSFYIHDDSGWDIGAYIAVAKDIVSRKLAVDILLCCGGSTFFRRAGWLSRIVEAWNKHGQGMYGANSTYEVSPHLNTSGFWCSPKLLADYPIKVATREQRYNFEHGPQAFWKRVLSLGFPVKLVTWDGEYDWPNWRRPLNIFRRGDQSNCPIYWHHHVHYEQASAKLKAITSRHTDALADPLWRRLKRGKVSKTERQRLEIKSRKRFLRAHKFYKPVHTMSLPTITVVAVTSLSPQSHAEAIQRTVACLPHPCRTLLVAPHKPAGFTGEHVNPVKWMPGGKWTKDTMGGFLLRGLAGCISTDLIILVQWDGYALNKDKWDDKFLGYDFVGAPWPRGHVKHLPLRLHRGRVGNGGFSIRSKRWLEACRSLPPSPVNEDFHAACIHREHFEKAGCVIAPMDVAIRFSFEQPVEEFPGWKLADSFGYHGFTEKPERAHLRLNQNV